MVSSFEQAGAQLAGVAAQQTDLQRAVAAGELWMEAGVAERAAARCDQAVEEINDWLNDADRLTQRRKFATTRTAMQPLSGSLRPDRTSSTR